MKILSAFGMIAALAATDASAQGVDLTGQYRCVQLCAAGSQGQPAFVTQNGWDLNLLNEAGEPSRAWIDWFGHIWAQSWNEGAMYSRDGMVIQFDRGSIWQRDLGEPPAAIPDRSNAKRPAKINPAKINPTKINPTKTNQVATNQVATNPAATSPATTRERVSAPVPSRAAKAAAAATAAFDGSWSVVILTQSGYCDRAYRYGVQISNGDVVYDGGGPVDLQGHVSPNGNVRVSVSGGGQQADGQGRMSRTLGTGTWRGQGASGPCTGVWQAERRG